MNIKRIILLSGDESHRLMDDGYHVQINYRHQQLCKSKETARNETERERERERERRRRERERERKEGDRHVNLIISDTCMYKHTITC